MREKVGSVNLYIYNRVQAYILQCYDASVLSHFSVRRRVGVRRGRDAKPLVGGVIHCVKPAMMVP